LNLQSFVPGLVDDILGVEDAALVHQAVEFRIHTSWLSTSRYLVWVMIFLVLQMQLWFIRLATG
jgi:hypothetical protein